MKLTAEEFNAKHPVGTPVRYWPVLPPNPAFPPVETVTRTEAWTLGHGQPVVSIEGKAGGVDLEHIELSDHLMAGTIWTLNKHGQPVAADPDSRDRALYDESTRDVIFLLQVRQFIGLDPEYLTIGQNAEAADDGMLWVSVDMFDDAEIEEAKKKDQFEKANDEHDYDAILMDDQELMDKGWVLTSWRTESVWLRRAEAEAYATAKAHRYGTLNKSCRVFGDCAEGRLAKVLDVVKNKDVEAFLQSPEFRAAYVAYRKAHQLGVVNA